MARRLSQLVLAEHLKGWQSTYLPWTGCHHRLAGRGGVPEAPVC